MTNEQKQSIAKLAKHNSDYLNIVAQKVGISPATAHIIISNRYGGRKEQKFRYSEATIQRVWDEMLILAREQAALISALNLPDEDFSEG